MKCTQCGSDMWDNRGRKKNPKQPDYACKNKECGYAIWDTPQERTPVYRQQANRPQVQQAVSKNTSDIEILKLAVQMACNPDANIDSVNRKYVELKNILAGKHSSMDEFDMSNEEAPF